VAAGDELPTTTEQGSQKQTIEAELEQRIERDPTDAASLRLLARFRYRQKRYTEGRGLLTRVIKLQPDSAAAWFDSGRYALKSGNEDEAVAAFERVIQLAPESEYASDASVMMDEADLTPIVQVGYEVTRFDGRNAVDSLRDLPAEQSALGSEPFRFQLELGAIFDSNIQLAPSSRELSAIDLGSFQGFGSPDAEWTLIDQPAWRAGAVYRGHFTLNEGNFRAFNLQSHVPGIFVESVSDGVGPVLIPRAVYEYTRDEFDGETFGQRHALTSALSTEWDESATTTLYVAVNQSEFVNDGDVPSIQSQDGRTTSLGLSHQILPFNDLVTTWTVGIDGAWADVDGSDFRYYGVSVFSVLTRPLPCDADLTASASWGYRDYFDFEGAPSRNENVWHVGGEGGKRLNDYVRIAGVVGYDRFESENVLFDADRLQVGLLTTLAY